MKILRQHAKMITSCVWFERLMVSRVHHLLCVSVRDEQYAHLIASKKETGQFTRNEIQLRLNCTKIERHTNRVAFKKKSQTDRRKLFTKLQSRSKNYHVAVRSNLSAVLRAHSYITFHPYTCNEPCCCCKPHNSIALVTRHALCLM